MLDNTRQAWDRLKKDLNALKYLFLYGFNSLLLIYYILMVILQKGNVVANAILLCLSFSSFCFAVVLDINALKKQEKRNFKKGKHVLTTLKILIKAYTLGASLYAMYVSTVGVNAVSIIITTLLILLWVISVLVEIIVLIFELEYYRMLDAIEKDFHAFIQVKKGVEKVVEGVKDTVVGVGEFASSTATKIKGYFNKNKKTRSN